MIRFGYNPGDQPVTIDPDGHQLGGKAWGPVDDNTAEVSGAVTDSRIVILDPPKRGAAAANPDAQAGIDAYHAVVARAKEDDK